MSDSVRPHRRQPTRLPRPWDSPGKNTGVGCHFLLQCMKVKSKSEITQSCPTLSDPMDCSLPGSSVHGICQARVLEWAAIAFCDKGIKVTKKWTLARITAKNVHDVSKCGGKPAAILSLHAAVTTDLQFLQKQRVVTAKHGKANSEMRYSGVSFFNYNFFKVKIGFFFFPYSHSDFLFRPSVNIYQ